LFSTGKEKTKDELILVGQTVTTEHVVPQWPASLSHNKNWYQAGKAFLLALEFLTHSFIAKNSLTTTALKSKHPLRRFQRNGNY